MSLNFDRKVNLTVSNESEAFVIENLRIDFNINKSEKGASSDSEISIYNLNEFTRKKILSEFKGLELKAGYGKAETILFSGYLRKAYTKKQGPDIVLNITAGEGDLDFKLKTINKTYQNTTLQEILEDLVSNFDNLKVNLFKGFDNIKITNRPIVLSGSILDSINKLSKRYAFKWNLSNNNINFRTENSFFGENYFIDVNSGMINIPELSEDGLITINSLLYPNLNLGNLIKVKSKFLEEIELANNNSKSSETEGASGIYLIEQLSHRGSSYSGQEFYTMIGGRRYVPR